VNPNTWISFVTSTIGAAASAAATDGIINGNTAQTIVSAAGIAVPFVWGLFIHRDSKVVQTASQVPGVAPIQVTPAASPAIQAMAADSSIPTVVPASSAPLSPTASQRR
jgi:hypothetical protein